MGGHSRRVRVPWLSSRNDRAPVEVYPHRIRREVMTATTSVTCQKTYRISDLKDGSKIDEMAKLMLSLILLTLRENERSDPNRFEWMLLRVSLANDPTTLMRDQ